MSYIAKERKKMSKKDDSSFTVDDTSNRQGTSNDLSKHIIMTLLACKKDEDFVLSTNFPIIGTILLEFTTALMKNFVSYI